ncbi:hypothetical protein SAMN05421678_101449 [Actinopolymorpha cephalotaxi]|uniref:Uncharacterized protein YukE n=1 Tax=Actinopolymorpha cephalotaxi TaxID=504797 RepID=A0A1I2KS74_9ACTN|nr:uncharacterized protein YukE [Actinopolymorpha cephalotaxi]SFF69090.1 hypothetical protein SAMN05421678_101449 [Actinopolymorpha cephalotaxi]
MSFSVAPDDLDGFAHLLRRAGEDAEALHAHLRRYGEIPPASQGAALIFGGTHQDLVNALTSHALTLTRLLDAARTQVHSAATSYRTVDDAAAARLDAALPPATR